jgi:light-harvesting complex I chlorophyll a/b binding protein 5
VIRYAEAEKTNGRWAMMAVTGILGQELLGVTPAWWEAGAKEYDIPAQALTPIEFIVMGFLEIKRYQGFKQTGTVSTGALRRETR